MSNNLIIMQISKSIDMNITRIIFNVQLPSFSLQVNNICRDMIRKDLSDNIMEISHSRGTDRWLVMKKQLDASHVRSPQTLLGYLLL